MDLKLLKLWKHHSENHHRDFLTFENHSEDHHCDFLKRVKTRLHNNTHTMLQRQIDGVSRAWDATVDCTIRELMIQAAHTNDARHKLRVELVLRTAGAASKQHVGMTSGAKHNVVDCKAAQTKCKTRVGLLQGPPPLGLKVCLGHTHTLC